jgi:endonuclease/exonuclease/phosphatase family metal-dependent hydrolase
MTTAVSIVSLNACGLPFVRPSFSARAAEFSRRLDELAVDIVNFQEVHTYRRLALLRSHLPSLPYVSSAPGALRQPRGGVVTFSRYPIEPSEFISFARTMRHTRLGTALVGLRAYSKGVLVSRIPDLPLTVANVHLSPNKDGDWSPSNRYCTLLRAQLSILRSRLDATILTGDFNLANGSGLHDEFMADGEWRDAFDGDDRPTFHAEFLPPGSSSSRIDYVLLKGDRMTVDETRLLFEERVPIGPRNAFLSDHVGLYVRATLNYRAVT